MERVLIEGRVVAVQQIEGTSQSGKPYSFWETTVERTEPVRKSVSSDARPELQEGQPVVLPCEVYAGNNGRMRYRLIAGEPIRTPQPAAPKG